MPATNFHEYARGIEDVLDATVSAGEVVLVSIQIDPRSALRGFIAGVLQFGDASELHFREFVDTGLSEPRLVSTNSYLCGYRRASMSCFPWKRCTPMLCS